MTMNTIKELIGKSAIWWCWGIFLFLLFAVSPSYAHRVAIFDFDDRLKGKYTVAQHIEKRLEDTDPQIQVLHFNGKGNEKHSIKVLTSLDQAGYDLIITITSDALILAHHTVKKTPVLYTNANNPLFLGFRTLEQPGGNISGASYYVSIEDQVRIYKRIYPQLTHVGFLFDGENRSRKVELPESRNTCERLGVAYEIEIITLKTELRNAVRRMLTRGIDAVIATSSGKIYQNIGTFIDLCNASSIPVFSFNKEGVKQGAVAALASDYYRMVDELILPMATKVLKENISPGLLSAAFLQKNAVYLNKTQIDRLRLSIPEEIVQGANWVK
jgi:ABC-type uncharacterized transport system substrate-binding protein